MLPKAHLTSHSKMSGFRRMIRPSWLSGSWRSFLYSSSVFLLFLSFIVPIFAWNVPLISLIFLKRSVVFPILLFSSISLHWLLRKAFLSLLAILWNSAFSWIFLSSSPLLLASLFSAIYNASSDNHFTFFHFFPLGDGLFLSPWMWDILLLLGSNILLSMVVQQLVVVLLFSQEKMSVHPSTSLSCEGVIIIFCIILFIGFCGTDNFILYLAKYKYLCYIMNINFYRKGKLLW